VESRDAAPWASRTGRCELPLNLRLERLSFALRKLLYPVKSQVRAGSHASPSLLREVGHERREIALDLGIGELSQRALGVSVDRDRERFGRTPHAVASISC